MSCANKIFVAVLSVKPQTYTQMEIVMVVDEKPPQAHCRTPVGENASLEIGALARGYRFFEFAINVLAVLLYAVRFPFKKRDF